MMSNAASAKQAVNMTLTTDIVRRAKALVGARNLSATVERLLETFVADGESRQATREEQIAQWVAATNAFVAEHGLPGEEFSPY